MNRRDIIFIALTIFGIILLYRDKLLLDNKFSKKLSNNISIVDTSKFHPDSKGFAGAAFDGRFIYFSPIGIGSNYSDLVARFDTMKEFTYSSSWSFFNTGKLHREARGFGGAVYDGRYIYFIPNYGSGSLSGLVVRYDTTKEFSAIFSWEYYDTAQVNSNSRGFWGGIFDGKYIYLIPHHLSSGKYSGQVTRYDTSKDFNSLSSWSFFDTAKVNSSSKGFVGAVFDGEYIYLVPNRTGIDDYNGQVTRFDTTGDFYLSSSWSFFDTEKLHPKSKGFAGGVFDGRYIYFAPLFSDTDGFGGQVTRYDTKIDFFSSSAWTFFDTISLNADSKGFTGAVFDGRFIYFTPFRKSYEDKQEANCDVDLKICANTRARGYSGLLVQHDTNNDFLKSTSWKFNDLTKIDKDLKGFWGGVFDGRFLYLTPDKTNCNTASGKVVRYDTYNF